MCEHTSVHLQGQPEPQGPVCLLKAIRPRRPESQECWAPGRNVRGQTQAVGTRLRPDGGEDSEDIILAFWVTVSAVISSHPIAQAAAMLLQLCVFPPGSPSCRQAGPTPPGAAVFSGHFNHETGAQQKWRGRTEKRTTPRIKELARPHPLFLLQETNSADRAPTTVESIWGWWPLHPGPLGHWAHSQAALESSSGSFQGAPVASLHPDRLSIGAAEA